MIKSPRKCALRINSLRRSRSLTRCSLRFHPAANRSVPTEREIEEAINSRLVIHLKDGPKRRERVVHKRSIVPSRDGRIVPGGDKEMSFALIVRADREVFEVVVIWTFWEHFVSFPQSENKEDLTFLIQ